MARSGSVRDWMRLAGRLVVAVLVATGLGTIAMGVLVFRGGISARPDPGPFESYVAPRLRSMAIPRAARDARNPVAASPLVVRQGMEHYADHCAICHANDGSGDTEIGRHLSPRVPDMRLPATQTLTDGELLYVIQNGVRFTGMPAWGGDHESDDANWKLVHFIRHVPSLTPAELSEMRRLNPKGPAEQIDSEEFLKGAPARSIHAHGRSGR